MRHDEILVQLNNKVDQHVTVNSYIKNQYQGYSPWLVSKLLCFPKTLEDSENNLLSLGSFMLE